jgi:transcriptional regulator GlxA family with amidase domain
MAPKRIGFIGFDNFAALHFAGLCEVFAAAALDDGFSGQIPCYEVYLIGLSDAPFRAESGMVFTPEWTIEAPSSDLDTLIIPGGAGMSDGGTAAAICRWALTRVNRTRRLASIGSGIYPLALSGLLDGKEVTTHWQSARDIARQFPKLKVLNTRPFVKQGWLYTASGLAGGIELVLAFIEEDYGIHLANTARGRLMAYLVRRDGSPNASPNAIFDSESTDRLGNLVGWIVKNLDADLSVDALARRACMCPGHFNRAFKSVFGSTPSTFVENLRLNEAKRRLARRGKTLRSVAASVGFSNSSTFRKAFQRRFGVIPSRYLDGVRSPRLRNAAERSAA